MDLGPGPAHHLVCRRGWNPGRRRFAIATDFCIGPYRCNRIYALAALLALGSVAALSVDLWVLEAVREARLGGDLRRMVTLSEVFAHGLGALAIIITVVVLDPRRMRALPRLALCVFLPGLLVNAVKTVVARQRPRNLEFASVWDSFIGWGPALQTGELSQVLDNGLRSFPSGHASTATGLALVLALFYPRGTILFATFAVLACFQRLHENAHFLSDTLAGAAIACLIAGFCCDPAGLGRVLDRWEGRCGITGVVTPREGSVDPGHEAGVQANPQRIP